MPPPSSERVRRARHQPERSARIVGRRPLLYAEGADPSLDRPAYVRAASGIAWVGARLAAVQDDARFIAMIEPSRARATAIALPVGPDGKRLHDSARGTKPLKLDLEACFAVESAPRATLFAIGSGSSPAREQIAQLSFATPDATTAEVTLVHARALYTLLRDTHAFSGSELNIEGAVARGERLLLFQRGNGAEVDGRKPQNAVAELALAPFIAYVRGETSEPPPVSRIERYELGEVAGVPFTFTDATLAGDEVLFLAGAEASADVVSDGLVHGTRIGAIDGDGAVRTWPLLDEQGLPARVKAEGIAAHRHAPGRLYLVTDMDDPALASELLEVELR